ncbi:MAG: nucleoside recognition domain-containing protein [Hominimerdicola sp.]
MLGFLILVLMILSILAGFFTGQTDAVSASALSSCNKAVELVIYLAGSMALWGGVMRIADKSGLTKKIGRMISPITSLLFKDINNNPKAKNAVTMNITANLFGLGNAATPLGIAAAKALDDGSPNSKRNIAMLVVLNTASIQLIPTTIGAMRLAHGAENPFDITPAILITSLVSTVIGCLAVYALNLNNNTKI